MYTVQLGLRDGYLEYELRHLSPASLVLLLLAGAFRPF